MTNSTIETQLSPAEILVEVINATTAAINTDKTLALVRPKTSTTLVAGTTTQVTVRSGTHEFTIDEPPTLGGTNLAASPVEHVLAALGSCNVITYQVWAAKLGITVDTIEITLAGDLDVQGFFGLDPDVRAGFQSIDMAVKLTGPETDERYAHLTKLVNEHCPVLDVLTVGVPVRTTHTYNEE